jgi:hypothetical protein
MGIVCDRLDNRCSYRTGLLSATPNKPQTQLNSPGTNFQRSRPQYENNPGFVVATASEIANDRTGN